MMKQPPATSASSNGAHLHENEILSGIERLLDERQEPTPSIAGVVAPRLRRFAPLALLALVGAALALVPTGVKDALLTGRSVAHTPDR